MEMIRFGAFAGLPKQLLQASAKIWESAGFKVALFDDIGSSGITPTISIN
jgi:2-dehydropantoate 2-reductase